MFLYGFTLVKGMAVDYEKIAEDIRKSIEDKLKIDVNSVFDEDVERVRAFLEASGVKNFSDEAIREYIAAEEQKRKAIVPVSNDLAAIEDAESQRLQSVELWHCSREIFLKSKGIGLKKFLYNSKKLLEIMADYEPPENVYRSYRVFNRGLSSEEQLFDMIKERGLPKKYDVSYNFRSRTLQANIDTHVDTPMFAIGNAQAFGSGIISVLGGALLTSFTTLSSGVMTVGIALMIYKLFDNISGKGKVDGIEINLYPQDNADVPRLKEMIERLEGYKIVEPEDPKYLKLPGS